MACNTVEVLERRPDGKFNSLGWAGISCRTASDWYIIMTPSNKIIVDHLPSWEVARKVLDQYLRDACK